MHKLSRADSYLPHHEPAPKGKPKPADPMAVLAPGKAFDVSLLTTSPVHRLASHADLAIPAPRPGQDTNLGHPSRIGDELHYRDGSVTDLDGQFISSRAHALHPYKPTRGY